MPWVLLRTRNKNTGDRVNPHYSPLRGSAKSCQCSGFGGQRPPKHVQRPLNIFRSTWKCSEATKQLKTQLKTQLQTRVATLIKANVATWVLRTTERLNIRLNSRLNWSLNLSPMTRIFNFQTFLKDFEPPPHMLTAALNSWSVFIKFSVDEVVLLFY